VEAAMVAKYANGGSKAGNAVGILFIYLFVTLYGGCIDVSMYVYCSEIFPTLIRAHGVGFSISGLFVSALSKFVSFSLTLIPSQCVLKSNNKLT
jgi:hypothetical protein